MKNVLLLDYFFPPLAADWRGIAFARYMPEFGWRPHVVSADESVRYEMDPVLLQDIPPETPVARVPHANGQRLARSVGTRLKLWADFPDPCRQWIKPAYHAARQLLRTKQIDLIYTHSPSFATLAVARRLKREFGLPWIADFLDAWFGNDYFRASYEQTLCNPLRALHLARVHRFERAVMHEADHIVVIHRTLKEQFQSAHGIPATKISHISDGFFESDFTSLKPLRLYPDKLNVVFLGGTYHGFDEILSTFLRAAHQARSDVEVILIGRGAGIMQKFKHPNLTLISHVPRQRALAFGLGADFLLLAALPTANWHTPTKLYDYLRLGRPLLALVPPTGDAAQIIHDATAGHVLSYDSTTLRQQLSHCFQQSAPNQNLCPSPFLAQFERRAIVRRIAGLCDRVASGANANSAP